MDPENTDVATEAGRAQPRRRIPPEPAGTGGHLWRPSTGGGDTR